VRGLLGETLLAGFPGFLVKRRDGESLLIGAVADQSALFGVLAQVEALGLELREVRIGEGRQSSGEEIGPRQVDQSETRRA